MLRYLRVIQKWWWVFVLLCGLTVGAGVAISWLLGTQYEAEVTVKFSAPPSEAALLYSQFGQQAVYDEIEQSRASFKEMLVADGVVERALEILPDVSMTADELRNKLTVELSDAPSFMYIRVQAGNPKLAALLAMTIVETGRQQLGQLRAQPLANTRQFIERELESARTELDAAEAELMQFQVENKFGRLQSNLDIEYEAIQSLRITGDLARAEGDLTKARTINQIILEREAKLQNMIGLAVNYNQLANRVEHARDTYNFLLDRKFEAQIKEQQMREAGFIQILSPIPSSSKFMPIIDFSFIVYGAVSSVLMGGLVAFLLEQLQQSGAWPRLRPRFIPIAFPKAIIYRRAPRGFPVKTSMYSVLSDVRNGILERIVGLKFSTSLLRRGILTALLLLIFLTPALICTAARQVVVNEVAQVVKDNQKVQIVKEIIPPERTPTLLAVMETPPAATVVILPTASATLALLPTFDVEHYVLSTATPLPPSPLPTPALVFGLVTTPAPQRLNVRSGPGVAYELVHQLQSGAEVMILQRTQDGDWLEIETTNHQKGWVASQYIELVGDIKTVSIATHLPPIPTRSQLIPLNVEGGSASGQLAPGQTQWYTFFDDDEETILIFMFRPNISGGLQFFLYDEHQVSVWPPKAPDTLTHIGAGSLPAFDRDGSERTGELVWRGGPLVPGTRYYLHLVNHSNMVIQYCLATKDAYEWSCH